MCDVFFFSLLLLLFRSILLFLFILRYSCCCCCCCWVLVFFGFYANRSSQQRFHHTMHASRKEAKRRKKELEKEKKTKYSLMKSPRLTQSCHTHHALDNVRAALSLARPLARSLTIFRLFCDGAKEEPQYAARLVVHKTHFLIVIRFRWRDCKALAISWIKIK